MALTLVVAVIGISAAWFGDMRNAKQSGFVIQSDTLQDTASIDIYASKGMSGESIYPAVAKLGYFLGTQAEGPEGRELMHGPLPNGVAEAAKAATVYFPIQVIGTPDTDYENENRKSLDLQLQSANAGTMKADIGGNTVYYHRTAVLAAGEDETLDGYAGTWSALGNPTLTFNGKGGGSADGAAFTYEVSSAAETYGQNFFSVNGSECSAMLVDYVEEFNVEMCLVEGTLDVNGKFESEISVLPTDPSYGGLSGGSVFYENYGRDLYMLVQPGVTYYVKVVIYFNKVDEFCDRDLLDTVVRFNFKLNILSDGGYIRGGEYKGDGTL